MTYYFDKNYKFKYIDNKRIFITKYNINNLIYFVKEVKEELNELVIKNDELINLVKAYTGQLPLSPVTKNNYENIITDIKNGDEYIITEGFARTGKTIICMRLLNDFPSANLLLMNVYFYKSLKNAFLLCGVEFPENRIFHHSLKEKKGSWQKGAKCNLKFLIVDEAQRLGVVPYSWRYDIPEFDEIKAILNVSDHEHTVFFGDSFQMINDDFDKGLNKIISEINANGYGYKKYYFDYSIGLPLNILNVIKSLLFKGQFNCMLNEYEIKIYDDCDDFVNSYENCDIFKKHLATLYLGKKNYNIGKYVSLPYDLQQNSRFEYLFDTQVKAEYLLFPYLLISRELDVIYIYIPKDIYYENGEIKCNINNKYYINQLYVLMTRARLSIHIYCEDVDLNIYLKREIEVIKNNQNLKNYDFKNLNSEEKSKARQVMDEIDAKGITRLIHFTEEKNIESIKKYGLLSRIELEKRGLLYDKNDLIRLDNYLDAISLSVQNPNHYLLNNFKLKYPEKKYKAIILHPELLYYINNKQGMKLAKRIYCNYNAAANDVLKSENDINIMYQDTVERFNWHSGNSWYVNRKNKSNNEPTAVQSEILFFEPIPPHFIMEIRDIVDENIDEE